MGVAGSSRGLQTLTGFRLQCGAVTPNVTEAAL